MTHQERVRAFKFATVALPASDVTRIFITTPMIEATTKMLPTTPNKIFKS
jgi:hypothetical protein